jgi:hypothetical protein
MFARFRIPATSGVCHLKDNRTDPEKREEIQMKKDPYSCQLLPTFSSPRQITGRGFYAIIFTSISENYTSKFLDRNNDRTN